MNPILQLIEEIEQHDLWETEVILDRNELDNVIKTNTLEIAPKTIDYSEGAKTEKYVFQIDKEGNVMKNETEFRVVIDNRK